MDNIDISKSVNELSNEELCALFTAVTTEYENREKVRALKYFTDIQKAITSALNEGFGSKINVCGSCADEWNSVIGFQARIRDVDIHKDKSGMTIYLESVNKQDS